MLPLRTNFAHHLVINTIFHALVMRNPALVTNFYRRECLWYVYIVVLTPTLHDQEHTWRHYF